MRRSAEMVKKIEKQGFSVKLTRSNHYMIFDPAGRYVTSLGLTPSCSRTWQNTLIALKRAGFVWPPPSKGQR